MKNMVKLFGTQSRWLCAIALVVVIGLGMAGCDTDDEMFMAAITGVSPLTVYQVKIGGFITTGPSNAAGTIDSAGFDAENSGGTWGQTVYITIQEWDWAENIPIGTVMRSKSTYTIKNDSISLNYANDFEAQ